jgi:hypothetical protein
MDERKSFMALQAKPENNKSLKDNRETDNRHRRQCRTQKRKKERERKSGVVIRVTPQWTKGNH